MCNISKILTFRAATLSSRHPFLGNLCFVVCAAQSGDPLLKWHSFDQEEGAVNEGKILLAYELVKRTTGVQPKSEKEKVMI